MDVLEDKASAHGLGNIQEEAATPVMLPPVGGGFSGLFRPQKNGRSKTTGDRSETAKDDIQRPSKNTTRRKSWGLSALRR